MSTFRVIGLSGKARVGKSYLAGLLRDMIPGACRLAFGDAIRQETAELFRIPADWMNDQSMKATTVDVAGTAYPKRYATIRELMQWVSLQRRREDPLHWSRKLHDGFVRCAAKGYRVAIVDDIRFLEDVAVWEGTGIGPTCRIHPFPGWVPGPHAGHVSETQLDSYDRWTVEYFPPVGGLGVVAQDIIARFLP